MKYISIEHDFKIFFKKVLVSEGNSPGGMFHSLLIGFTHA